MPISKSQDISARIRSSVDPEYLTSLYRQACYAQGEKSVVGHVRGEWPLFPDIRLDELEIGRSRRILNSAFVGLSRTMYAPAKAVFPAEDPITSSVLEQFLAARGRGDGTSDSEWDSHVLRAYLDMEMLGFGACLLGMVENPASGLQRVALRHIPAWQVVWDRHARDPVEARHFTVMHLLDVEEAVAEFGSKAQDHIITLEDNASSEPFHAVRLYEHWDMGIAGADPTQMLALGDLDNQVLRQTNECGCLPWAPGTFLLAPGMRRPLGRVTMTMAGQEALNEIETYIRRTVRTGAPVDIVDTDSLDLDDVNAVNGGAVGRRIKRISKSDRPAWERVPAQEVPQTLLALRDMVERQLTADSGITDAERGTLGARGATATESSLVDSRSRLQGSWSKRQIIMLYRRLYERVLRLAAKYDRDPVVIEVDNVPILLNDPGDPRSSIDNFLARPVRVEIDAESLSFVDVKAERAERLGMLNQLMPDVQMGLIDPVAFSRERVTVALGEARAQQLVRQGAPMGMPGQMPMEEMPEDSEDIPEARGGKATGGRPNRGQSKDAA